MYNQNVADQSFPEFVASLIPSNIMDPFTSGNSLQLLVLAIIIGVAVGALRHKQTFVGKLIDRMNSIFIEVLNIILYFHLPKKYLNQSIPFCAHNNMDGNCLFLGVVCTAIAYGCNFEINFAIVGALIMFAIVLSAGAPNQPGSGIICMTVLLSAMGVDPIIMIYVVVLDLVCETLIACTNNISDMATVVCEAKREGLLKE